MAASLEVDQLHCVNVDDHGEGIGPAKGRSEVGIHVVCGIAPNQYVGQVVAGCPCRSFSRVSRCRILGQDVDDD